MRAHIRLTTYHRGALAVSDTEVFEIQTETRGRIWGKDVAYAREQIRSLARLAPERILFARVRLTRLHDPAVPRPFVAQCNLDVGGRLVRAQAAAGSGHEAVHHMVDRLRIRLERFSRTWETQRGRRPAAEPGEWRHTSRPAQRPPYYPRPRAEREVVRHKSFALARQSVDEAIFDMAMLDYEFHLFTDSATDQDSVVYRSGDRCRLAQLTPQPDRIGPTAVEVTVSPHSALTLTLAEAIERLELTELPFVFYADATTGRGNVLYHRYDGHYGLITPAQ